MTWLAWATKLDSLLSRLLNTLISTGRWRVGCTGLAFRGQTKSQGL
eukprot:XP_001708038.1 Hypothetical protein GL50803_38719 [Giardia lamblia ATCC 50803]